ncbi:hypothetical protein V6767_20310 [Martelella sp. FLE1502]
MSIKTPVRIVGDGPHWAIEDADKMMVATVYDYQKGEEMREAINLVYRANLKPREDVIIRRVRAG